MEKVPAFIRQVLNQHIKCMQKSAIKHSTSSRPVFDNLPKTRHLSHLTKPRPQRFQRFLITIKVKNAPSKLTFLAHPESIVGLWSAFQVCLSGPSLYGKLWRVPISSPNPTPHNYLCSSSGLGGPFSDLYWCKEHISPCLLPLGYRVYESGENHTFWKLCLHLDTDTVVKVTISAVPGRIQTLR